MKALNKVRDNLFSFLMQGFDWQHCSMQLTAFMNMFYATTGAGAMNVLWCKTLWSIHQGSGASPCTHVMQSSWLFPGQNHSGGIDARSFVYKMTVFLSLYTIYPASLRGFLGLESHSVPLLASTFSSPPSTIGLLDFFFFVDFQCFFALSLVALFHSPLETDLVISSSFP